MPTDTDNGQVTLGILGNKIDTPPRLDRGN
jgi:hypothetical protein